jgi:hypothetical protein
MRVWSPLAIASHPIVWADVGAAKEASNHARAASENRSRATDMEDTGAE